MNTRSLAVLAGLLGLFGSSAMAAEGPTTRVRIEISERGRPVPCRVHLKDTAGRAVRPPGLPFWRDHFVCTGQLDLELARGNYLYEVERGPEYRRRQGELVVADGMPKQALELERLVDLAAEGWWSGELHVHRPVEDVPLLLAAEDLHVAPVITWWNDRNLWAKTELPDPLLHCSPEQRCYHVMGGEDEREGGALLYFHLTKPLAIQGASREYPSPMRFLEQARAQPGAWIDIEKPFWWDAPVWLASGKVDSIGLANNHMCREGMYEDEAWGKPRDASRWPAPRGNGFWTQEIYYHLLNCGLRVPPSAGSASGVLPNPVGYNRVYVFLEGGFDYNAWWKGLKAGRSFVSNGPLLRVQANGHWPGHTFVSDGTNSLRVELEANLTTQDPISTIEIIKNGRVTERVPYTAGRGPRRLASLRFTESGWFLVRAIADNPKTFRFASTAPFYVEVGAGKSRISKASAQFFVDWVRERKARVRLDDMEQRREVLRFHDQAEAFWSELRERANADD